MESRAEAEPQKGLQKKGGFARVCIPPFYFTRESSPSRKTIIQATEGKGGEKMEKELSPPGRRDDYNEIIQRVGQIVEERRPETSAQKKAAFANSVAYLVTGWAGGYGGPSVREHAACRKYGQRGPLEGHWSFEEASELLLKDDGPIFGPITSLHRLCWREEYCFDDDPEDIVELERG